MLKSFYDVHARDYSGEEEQDYQSYPTGVRQRKMYAEGRM